MPRLVIPSAVGDVAAVLARAARATTRRLESDALLWRAVVRQAIAVWLVTRLVVVATTAVATLLLVAGRAQSGSGRAPERVTLEYVVGRWTLWDGGYYIQIARANYPRPMEAAFFPLYPLLIRLAHPFWTSSNMSWVLTALVVSNLATLAAFIGIGLLAAHEYGVVASARPILRVLVAYPLAFFLAAAYTDGLFLALAAFALLAARRQQWWRAAGCMFFAALTRPTAIILIPPLLWELGRAYGWRLPWREPRRLLAGLGLSLAVPAGFGAYAVYCAIRFRDPLAFVHAQSVFGIQATPPWQTARLIWTQVRTAGLGTFEQTRTLLDVLPVLALIVVTLVMVRRQPVSFTLYAAGLALLCLSSPIVIAQFPDALAGGGRFMLAAVPLWLALGRWCARYAWLDGLLVSGGFMLQAVLLAFVVTGGWLI
ncbi:MAG TPA: hypothetical protein VF818_11540 [Ktedonobacterales bacterium]